MDKIKVYSPRQVAVGALVGGPLAAVYFLWVNFKKLGQAAEARYTLVLGIAANVLLIILMPFVPDKFPNSVIPLAYAGLIWFLADVYQKQTVTEPERYVLRSNWNVFWIALGQCILWFAVVMGIYFELDALGVPIFGDAAGSSP